MGRRVASAEEGPSVPQFAVASQPANPFIPYSDEAPPSPDRDPSEMLQEQQLLMNRECDIIVNIVLLFRHPQLSLCIPP